MIDPTQHYHASVPSQPSYSGGAKAALVLLAMDRSNALQLLKSLDQDEVRLILRRAAELRMVEGTDLSSVISEFEQAFNTGLNFVGTTDEVRGLIEEALGSDGSRDILFEATPADNTPPPWTEIAQLTDEVLVRFLDAQHPQVAAHILSLLEQARTVEIIKNLPPESANDLLTRLLAVKPLHPAIVTALERSVREALLSNSSSSDNAVHQIVAGIINEFDVERSKTALDHITKSLPDDARIVAKLLFKFEDLPRLSTEHLALVVERLPVERIVIALRNADPALQESILGAMAPRARRMAESELRSDAQIAPKTIAEARRLVAQAVLGMASSGTIELPKSEDAS